MTRSQLFSIVLLIIITGTLGGLGNYYMIVDDIRTQDLKVDFSSFSWQKSIILGIIASSVIPLFLNIISSNLLDLTDNESKYKKYLILSSLCVVAALFSNRFLTGAYNQAFRQLNAKVEKVEKIAEKSENKADAALSVELNQESDVDENVLIERIRSYHPIDEDEEMILKKLLNKKFYNKQKLIEEIGGGQAIIKVEKLIEDGILREFENDGRIIVIISSEILSE